MKKILGLLMILMVGSITQASDNRSAPNVFSSGSTISSSQMNENFNFLASNYREKTIDCDAGETIASAIDAGYNFLTIFGTCDGAFMVYMMDPIHFGDSFSDYPNKSINHLIIKGGSENRAAKILNNNEDFNSMVTTKGFLQLYNLTYNGTLEVDDGSVVFIDEVNIGVTIDEDGEEDEGEVDVYGNSYLSMKNSTITGEVEVRRSSFAKIRDTNFIMFDAEEDVLVLKEKGHVDIEDSTVNGSIYITRGSHLEGENTNITCENTYHSCVKVSDSIFDFEEININCSNISVCLNANGSKISLDEVSLTTTLVQYNAIALSDGSKAIIEDSTISTDGTTSGINLRVNSILEIEDSSITTNDGTGMYLNNGSYFRGDNVNITRTNNTPTVDLGTFSILKLRGSSSSINDIYCYDTNVDVDIDDEVTSTVNKNSSCDGNSTPNFIRITSGNCETNGYNNLTSAHECAQATGGIVRSLHDPADLFGCAEGTTWIDFNSYSNSWITEEKGNKPMWCKE